MPGDKTLPRGEAGRVALRVRALLADADGPGTAEPDGLDDVAEMLPAVAPGRAARRVPPAWWEQLAARVPVRLDPGRRAAVTVGVAVLLAAIVTGIWLVSSRPQAVPVSASVPSVPGAGPLVGTDGATVGSSGSAAASVSAGGSASSAVTSSAAVVVVDVAGKVRRPGVYRLASGSRVDDAIRAAGGAVGHVDLSTLNLAALLVDGQQVAVGVPPAVAGAGGGTEGGTEGGAVVGATGAAGPSGAGAGGTVVDLNTATLEQLETLPGVGPVLGQDILDYRNAHGSFASIDQLQDVSGIGDVKFGELKSLVTV